MKDHLLSFYARMLLYGICRGMSGCAVTCLTGVRHFNVPDLTGMDGVILASNHQSFLDPVLVGMAIDHRVHYLARSSLFRPPVFGRLIHALGAHPLQRGQTDSAALRTALKILKRGEPLLLFPEGTRSRDGALGTFRSGASQLAARCEVPIIPVCVEGAYEAWPRSQTLPRPARTAVVYGEAMRAEGQNGEELNERVVRCISEMQTFLKGILGRAASGGRP